MGVLGHHGKASGQVALWPENPPGSWHGHVSGLEGAMGTGVPGTGHQKEREDRQCRVYLLARSSRSRPFPGSGREDIRLETQRADPRVLHPSNLCRFLTAAWPGATPPPPALGGAASLGPDGPPSRPQLTPSPVACGSTQGPQCRANWPFETCVIFPFPVPP